MDNLYIPELARVVRIKEETPHIRSLEVALEKPREFKAVPGQFIEFTVFGYGEFPVSLADLLDESSGSFLVTIQKAGKVTGEVFRLNEGDQVGVRGPFGNGFPLEKMIDRDVLLIGGGVGLAAIWNLIKHLLINKEQFGVLRLFYGARTPEDIIYKEELFAWQREGSGLEVHLTVDRANPNWSGQEGFVSELFKGESLELQRSVAVVCGPGHMMKATTDVLLELGLESEQIYLSMERRMQCGMGACGHCMIGSQRVCLDGPVFSLAHTHKLSEERFSV